MAGINPAVVAVFARALTTFSHTVATKRDQACVRCRNLTTTHTFTHPGPTFPATHTFTHPGPTFPALYISVASKLKHTHRDRTRRGENAEARSQPDGDTHTAGTTEGSHRIAPPHPTSAVNAPAPAPAQPVRHPNRPPARARSPVHRPPTLVSVDAGPWAPELQPRVGRLKTRAVRPWRAGA